MIIMQPTILDIEFLPLYENVTTPTYATEGSAGFDIVVHNFKKYFTGDNEYDLAADYKRTPFTSVKMFPHSRLLVGTGFKVAMPNGVELDIRPLSGKSLKEGVTVCNAPGTIDSDYRGEVGVILINTSEKAVVISEGDRVAQGIFFYYIKANWMTVESLSETQRGEGGFGSTGN